jgi:hypothetical protein
MFQIPLLANRIFQRQEGFDPPLATRAEYLDDALAHRCGNLLPRKYVLGSDARAAQTSCRYVFRMNLTLHTCAALCTQDDLHHDIPRMCCVQ